MRHRVDGKKLGRTTSHRQALLSNLAVALFKYGKIQTTEPKSKELRRTAEKLISLAKKNDLHTRRQAARIIRDHAVLKKLFEEIAPKYSDRNGGYTRIIKLGPRLGDAAPMSIIELV
jgi:large subunit ribosomal protein L17